MADEQTNPATGSPRRPTSLHDIGKGMAAFFPGATEEDSGGVATDEEPEPEQEAPESDELELELEQAEDEDVGDEDISEDEDAEPEAEDTSDGFRLTLTVNGEEVVVEDEEEARSLAQRGKHYTQEMQALREEQRQWESEKREITDELQQEKHQYAAALDTLEQTFQGALGTEPDWNSPEIRQLREENPRQYAQLRDQWDQLRTIQAERERIAREQQEEHQGKLREWVEDQRSELAAKKPEWASDPSKRQQDLESIRDYALERGVTEEELDSLYDHRFWLILHDATRYRQAQSTGKRKAKAAKKKTAKPGSGGNQTDSRNRRERKLHEALAETGDVRVAGEILQRRMTKKKK